MQTSHLTPGHNPGNQRSATVSTEQRTAQLSRFDGQAPYTFGRTLTKAQYRQLREIGRRIIRAIDQDDHRLDDRPLPAARPAQAP